MPRSDAAKQWQPDAFGQTMIDQISNYILVSAHCTERLRSFDYSLVEPLWKQSQTVFNGDPITYPSAMTAQNDMKGRKEFMAKCQAICFPPELNLPHKPEDYMMMYFAAAAGLQSTVSQDLLSHPYSGEINYRANLQVIKALQGQSGYDAAVEFDRNSCDKPIDLLDEKIHCRDEVSGELVEYTIVDGGTSVLSGDYVVLEDGQGHKKQVMAEELHEIRADCQTADPDSEV